MPTKEQMDENLLTTLSMERNHLSTLLSMDSSSSTHDERAREFTRSVSLLQLPPDINLPLSAEPSPPPQHSWNDACEMLEVTLGPHNYDVEMNGSCGPKVGKKCANAKRLDSIWGAWFFFSFYFRPALNEKFKGKVAREANGLCDGYDKSDLKLEVFLVQHDMENMYMWVFKERPENALGKMQLRSYMNGHSRQGERPFPFSVEKGFVRSHRMQRKHYRGLSNPQCVHGIEVVRSPNLMRLDEEDRKRWKDLTGRDFNFTIPLEASDFGSWRNLSSNEFELERPLQGNLNKHLKKLINGSGLNLSTKTQDHVNVEGMDIVKASNKRKKNFLSHGNGEDCNLAIDSQPDRVLDIHAIEPPWLSTFSGVMRCAYGPVTAAKTIYEDDEGFLIVVSMPFADMQRVKVTWRNTLSHGIIKISCVSTGCVPIIKRQDRTFKLSDSAPEQCPQGEFIREISLPARIPDDAKLEAYGDSTGTMLEILVPKHCVGPEEHEVHVCLRSSPWSDRTYVDLAEALV
ncbi:Succinate--CoA ligase (ADP-forming) [Handroanthus impetiginosus]|uniref:Succinate--CoA ligase (ADP-forming) n=1 Tax=Handroanthus impetiginosus TaxID=429701 RepID=A0A2G9GRR0_9LAMI|nr:Succinate--CoA ligase (ADP-forming) [Handroanthus impetiginosus]